MIKAKLLGAIETGGTKTKCAFALYPDIKPDIEPNINNQGGQTGGVQANGRPLPQIIHQTQFPTTGPDQTAEQIIAYFKQATPQANGANVPNNVDLIQAIGIACFGPIDPKPASPTYGYITSTTKPGWQHYNFVGALKERFPHAAIGWDTDVNAPALAESLWGCAKNLDPVLYITAGTGIGGGAVVNGAPLHGLLHPEMGHILVRSHPKDNFSGCCPYHKYCLEGMASGTSIKARWGQRAEDLPPEHIGWEIEAYYLAQGLQNVILALSPQKVILGGGVMEQKSLFGLVRRQLQDLLQSYIEVPELHEGIDEYICAPALGAEAALYGALALAVQATQKTG